MTSVRELVARLALWIERLMPAGDRRTALLAALETQFGADDAPVTAEACAAIERAAWPFARHIALIYEPDGTDPPDTEAREWQLPNAATVRARAGCVSRVERRTDGTGVIRIDGLDPVGLAQPFIDAAFALLAGSQRIVLDLRGNGGGEPGTVALIAGWLLGDDPVQLSEVVGSAGRRQWWTPARPPGTALRQDTVVLVGPGTFSSGEALAYHLQHRGRVTVAGDRTPGAADHVLPIRLAPTVIAHVPRAVVIDTVTGSNWEGTGVIPDETIAKHL
ncbi:S41 family peptidase [Dactylosporangium sp. CS-033363]|uniref:S41 family peptidase n=1 Tax=Dactylosporangium sp. CS-033363 TaxID=3239935 RepID=UPI003D91F000